VNELIKLILGVTSVIIASYSKILILLPILFIVYSLYLIKNYNLRPTKTSYKFFCFLLAMSLIDRYDISYGVINIFYISLITFLIYQFFILYLSKGSLNLIWLYFLMISISIVLIISIRPIINIEDVIKWILLLSMPLLILIVEYKIDFKRFFLYLKDINIFLIGIGLGQFLAIAGYIPFSNASGLDMEYHVIRPTGLSSEPTWYSQQLAILLGINIFSGIRLSRTFYVISFISVLIIFLCFTRGAYLILFTLMSFLILKNLNYIFHKPIASLSLTIFSLFLIYSFYPLLGENEFNLNIIQKLLFQDASAGARLEGIASTINFWLERPFIGHGFSYNILMVTSEGTAINQKIFNSFLGSLATGGLFLFSLYLLVFLYLFINSIELYLTNSNYLALFIVTSYFLLSSVMPFAYSFFGIFITMILSIFSMKNSFKNNEM